MRAARHHTTGRLAVGVLDRCFSLLEEAILIRHVITRLCLAVGVCSTVASRCEKKTLLMRHAISDSCLEVGVLERVEHHHELLKAQCDLWGEVKQRDLWGGGDARGTTSEKPTRTQTTTTKTKPPIFDLRPVMARPFKIRTKPEPISSERADAMSARRDRPRECAPADAHPSRSTPGVCAR